MNETRFKNMKESKREKLVDISCPNSSCPSNIGYVEKRIIKYGKYSPHYLPPQSEAIQKYHCHVCDTFFTNDMSLKRLLYKKEKEEQLEKVIKGLFHGNSLDSVAKNCTIKSDTIKRWIKNCLRDKELIMQCCSIWLEIPKDSIELYEFWDCLAKNRHDLWISRKN